VVVSASQENRPDHGHAPEPLAASSPASSPEGEGKSVSAVIWHDLECGSYAADLPLWRELAAAGAVLDIGAGSGRVTLELARYGHRVTALDLDAELLQALRERAMGMSGERVETVCADARAFALERRDFALCLIPMQTIQMLGGASGRLQCLRRARAHLAPGGLLAIAIATEIEPFDCAAGDLGPSPEIARIDGAIYVSRATRVQVRRRSVRIERERSVLAAAGTAASSAPRLLPQRDVVELDRVGIAELQREGREAGLTAAGTRAIAPTQEHTGSVAVMFRA
jgi:SAM-dependent methyltransferase